MILTRLTPLVVGAGTGTGKREVIALGLVEVEIKS